MVIFTNKVGKNSRYFVGVFNKTIIPLALVGYEPTRRYAFRWLSTISNPTRTRGLLLIICGSVTLSKLEVVNITTSSNKFINISFSVIQTEIFNRAP